MYTSYNYNTILYNYLIIETHYNILYLFVNDFGNNLTC